MPAGCRRCSGASLANTGPPGALESAVGSAPSPAPFPRRSHSTRRRRPFMCSPTTMLLRPTFTFILPALPSPAERPPIGGGWIHEIKHDGYRMMVRCEASGVRLLSATASEDETLKLSYIVSQEEKIMRKIIWVGLALGFWSWSTPSLGESTCTAPGHPNCTITCPAWGCIALYFEPDGPCRTMCSGVAGRRPKSSVEAKGAINSQIRGLLPRR